MKTKLKPCPCCGVPGIVSRSSSAAHMFIGECSTMDNCKRWPVTEPKLTEAAAAEAWERGEVTEYTGQTLTPTA